MKNTAIVTAIALLAVADGFAQQHTSDVPCDATAKLSVFANEWAHSNPSASNRIQNPDFDQFVGTTYECDHGYWTGPPDGEFDPDDPLSRKANHSMFFKLVTRRQDYSGISVTVPVQVNRFIT